MQEFKVHQLTCVVFATARGRIDKGQLNMFMSDRVTKALLAVRTLSLSISTYVVKMARDTCEQNLRKYNKLGANSETICSIINLQILLKCSISYQRGLYFLSGLFIILFVFDEKI